jgi:DNA-binding response OmpR family regulator
MQSSRILVADDSRTVQGCLKRMLTAAGHEVALASDGREAVDLAGWWSPQLAILDILMPEMDGYTACDEILKQTTIPIVFLTKEPGKHLSALGMELGAYLSKPADEETLLATVNGLLLNRNSEVCPR